MSFIEQHRHHLLFSRDGPNPVRQLHREEHQVPTLTDACCRNPLIGHVPGESLAGGSTPLQKKGRCSRGFRAQSSMVWEVPWRESWGCRVRPPKSWEYFPGVARDHGQVQAAQASCHKQTDVYPKKAAHIFTTSCGHNLGYLYCNKGHGFCPAVWWHTGNACLQPNRGKKKRDKLKMEVDKSVKRYSRALCPNWKGAELRIIQCPTLCSTHI